MCEFTAVALCRIGAVTLATAPPDAAKVAQVVDAAQAGDRLSFRRIVQHLTVALGSEGGHE